MIMLSNPLMSNVVSLLCILPNMVNGPFLPNDADLKSLVCIAQILTRVHSSLDMDTQEQAKTWSRKHFQCVYGPIIIIPCQCVPLELSTSLCA